jgi:hypothetical protein
VRCTALLTLGVLLHAVPALSHGTFPEVRQILLPPDRPQQIILATNFGLIFSEDGGEEWLYSCEHGISAYAGPYLLGGASSRRILAITAGAGVIHSDDDACSWTAAGGALTEVMPWAFTVDPTSSKRVYAIGAPRENLQAGDGIYVSEDGGLTFGEVVFTAPARSALLTVTVVPSRPSALLATMYSSADGHPILLRSSDSGQHWEIAADLVDSLGTNPVELLAIDPIDENRVYARVLEPSAETLAVSDDGGLSFVRSVLIPGKLTAFLELASGTILVGGTNGTDGFGYRSRDRAQNFELWPEAPRVHALAERSGTLYVAADEFLDGYVIAESDDEGATLRPLTNFGQVQAVKDCVADACAEACAYYAAIELWPQAVCGEQSTDPVSDAGAGGNAADGGASGVDTGGAGGNQAASGGRSGQSASGGCACDLMARRPAAAWTWVLLALLVISRVGRRRVAHGRTIQGASSRPSLRGRRATWWRGSGYPPGKRTTTTEYAGTATETEVRLAAEKIGSDVTVPSRSVPDGV